MLTKKLTLCLVLPMAALSLMPVDAWAQETASDGTATDAAESGFSWNAAATSEYMFRGISQTDDHPALQLGANYTFANGLYVGTWASNVDFGEGTDAEVDALVGWNKDLSDATNLDVSLVRYGYVGQPDGVDYTYSELIGVMTFDEQYSLTLGYTNDYLNQGENSIYSALGGSWEVGGGLNLGASLGYTSNSGPLPSYLDYSVGLSRDFGPINASLQYMGTNARAKELFGDDNAEDKVVLTFSYGL